MEPPTVGAPEWAAQRDDASRTPRSYKGFAVTPFLPPRRSPNRKLALSAVWWKYVGSTSTISLPPSGRLRRGRCSDGSRLLLKGVNPDRFGPGAARCSLVPAPAAFTTHHGSRNCG
jgi:hypothetical protein